MPFHTRQGFVSMVAWALSFPKRFRRSSSSRRGTSQVTYVTMVPRGNETLRRMPYFLHPCERFLHFEAAAVSTAGAFILPGRYIISAGDVSRDSLGRITHVFQSVGTQRRSQSVFDAASRSLGEPWLHT